MTHQIVGLILSSLLLAQTSTCRPTFERATLVKLEGGNPPTFSLSGSGKLGDLVIYGPKQRDVGSDRNYALWEIKPINGFMEGEWVERLAAITYGIVPKAYEQVYPENGAQPLQLVPGERYEYWFVTVGSPAARKYFEIVDGKARELSDTHR